MDFLSLKEKLCLLDKISGLEELSFLTLNDLDRITGRGLRANRSESLAWSGKESARLGRAAALRIKALKIKAVFWGGAEYPALLKEISDPPFALYYRGSLEALDFPCVSVVGTRRVTPDGRRAARDFSYEAAKNGLCVVSGLALGVDGAAHRGALDAFLDGGALCESGGASGAQAPEYGGASGAIPENGAHSESGRGVRTAAVLAGGIDGIFPSCHKKLAGEIIKNGGCILSEYPPGVPAEKWRFVRRNRIVAGLSQAVLVVQAPPGSGALITAEFALDYNREVLFHRACFSKGAAAVSKMVHASLSCIEGSAARKKIERRPEFFVRDGAKIVEDYASFCAALF